MTQQFRDKVVSWNDAHSFPDRDDQEENVCHHFNLLIVAVSDAINSLQSGKMQAFMKITM